MTARRHCQCMDGAAEWCTVYSGSERRSRSQFTMVCATLCTAVCTASHTAVSMKAAITPEINEDDNADDDIVAGDVE